MNPRAAINDLLPFQGSPFSLLGTSPSISACLVYAIRYICIASGEGGIRTHAPLRTNGFQDRLVMTTSIPLHVIFSPDSAQDIYYHQCLSVSTDFCIFLHFIFVRNFNLTQRRIFTDFFQIIGSERFWQHPYLPVS